jgi:hypothetical protein
MNFSGKKSKHRKIIKNIIAHLGTAVASLGVVLAILEVALDPLDFIEVPRGVLDVHETPEVSFDTIATSLAAPVTSRTDPFASCKSLSSADVITDSAGPSDSNIPSEDEKPVSQGTQIVFHATYFTPATGFSRNEEG